MDTILGILPGESYNDIRTLTDLSVCVKYTNSGTQMVTLITWNDEMATCDDDQVLNLEKKKEKNKIQGDQGKGI